MNEISSTVDYTAIVTGGGSGIGRAAALELVLTGFTVIVAGRKHSRLEETASLAKTGKIIPIQTDVSDFNDVSRLFDVVENKYKRLDVLFNNAGIGAPPESFDQISPEDWQQCIDINITGSYLCAQHAFRMMKSQNPTGGRIINNGSISAHSPRPNSAPYTITKHAITGLTKSISLDGRPYNIACSQIDIGNADIPQWLKSLKLVCRRHLER